MWKKAIIIGGGVAGILTAKALSPFFEEILIIEADQEYEHKGPRKRTPQSYHPHIVLKKGEESIEALFPGFRSELMKKGSHVTNFTNDLKWRHFGHVKQRFKGDLVLNQQSRPLLEWQLNQFVKQISNVSTKYQVAAESLLYDQQSKKVTGVKIRSLPSNDQEELYADLVVDASGFGSKTTEWLKTYGVTIKEERIKIDLLYATRMYRLKKKENQDWKNLLLSVSYPDSPNYGAIQLIEDEHFLITVGGYRCEQSVSTNDDFFRSVKKLPLPDVKEFIEQAEPLTDVKIHKIPFQFRRRYDLAKAYPQNFIVIGDAHCRMDPLFAQGISVAASEVIELKKMLEKTPRLDKNFAKKFHKKVSKIIAAPWELAATEALRNPGIKGPRSILHPIKLWYTKKIFQVSAFNPEVYQRLVRVMNLIQPASHLFHPKVLWAVFTQKPRISKVHDKNVSCTK